MTETNRKLHRKSVRSSISLDYFRRQLGHPDFYLRLENELRQVFFPIVHDDLVLKQIRDEVYSLVGDMLTRNEIPLAKNGPNLDIDRKPIDSIVIHHTEEDPNLSLDTLNAIHFLRIYSNKKAQERYGIKLHGQPLWSNHFRSKRMVFYAYHFLVYPGGRLVRLLNDDYIGMHSGNLVMNQRSLAISLSGNYEHSSPPKKQIETTANLIKVLKRKYSLIENSNIFGHREIIKNRTCPGDQFNDWKKYIIKSL